MRYWVYSPLRYADFWGFAVRDTNGDNGNNDDGNDGGDTNQDRINDLYAEHGDDVWDEAGDELNDLLEEGRDATYTGGNGNGTTTGGNDDDGGNDGGSTTTTVSREYKTTDSGSVYFVDANGVNQYVAGSNWGQANPSTDLQQYLDSTNHPQKDTGSSTSGTATTGPVTVSVSVANGDTLSDLAVTYNTTVAAIANASNINLADVNDINIGDTLTIPSGSNTTGESIYVDVPQSVFDEKTPDGAISVDGSFYDAFGDPYPTMDAMVYGEDQRFKQESWSNPDNWEVVVDEQGQLDQKYTGDMGRPDNGAYTVPSLSTLAAAGNNDSGYDLEVIGGTTYMKDKYGQTYRDEDDLITGEKRTGEQVASYEDPSNYRIDANQQDELIRVYVGDEDVPSVGFETPSWSAVDTAQESASDKDDYYDLTFADGEMKVLDSYGNSFETPAEAVKNDLSINSHLDPSQYEVISAGGVTNAVYTGDYDTPEVQSGSTYLYEAPSVTDVLNNTTYKDKDYTVRFDDATQTITAVSSTGVDLVTQFGTELNEELVSAYGTAVNSGYSVGTDALEEQVTAIMTVGSMFTDADKDGYPDTFDERIEYGYDPVGPNKIIDSIAATEDTYMGGTASEWDSYSKDLGEQYGETAEETADFFAGIAKGASNMFLGALEGVAIADYNAAQSSVERGWRQLDEAGVRLDETRDDFIEAVNNAGYELSDLTGLNLSSNKDFAELLGTDGAYKAGLYFAAQAGVKNAYETAMENLEDAGVPLNDYTLSQWAEGARNSVNDFVGEYNDPDGLARAYGEGLGSAAAFLSVAIPAAAIGAPVIGTAAVVGLGGASNSASIYKEAIQSGASQEDAALASQFAWLSGPLEAIPIARVVNKLPPQAKNKFLNLIYDSGFEGGQEGLTQAYNNMIAKGIYDPNRGILDNVGESAVMGVLVGATVNAGVELSTADYKAFGYSDAQADMLKETSGMLAAGQITQDQIQSFIDKGYSVEEISDAFNFITNDNSPVGDFEGPPGMSAPTIEELAADSAFKDTAIVGSDGKPAVVYQVPGTNKFTTVPTIDTAPPVFVNVSNPVTIDGINNDTGFEKIVEIFGEDKATEIKNEYNETGTVTITDDMVNTVVDNGNDGIVINETGDVIVANPNSDTVHEVTDPETTTDDTVVATRPEWKNEMDQMYATMGGISLDEAQRIADQYGVPITEFGDYYKEMVAVNQPWKQAILDNYLMNGRVDFDTIKQIEADFGITTNEFNDFYKKLSIASADGFDAGILDAFEGEIDDLGGTIGVLEGQLDTAQDAANWVNSQLDADKSRNEIINTLKSEGGFSQTEAAKLYDSIYGFRETIGGLETDITGLETDVDTLTGERDFAEGAYGVVNDALASETDRQDIINNLVENGFDSASAASLVDTVQQIRETDAQLRSEKGFAQGAYNYVETRLADNATREEIFAELKDNGYTDATANTLLDDIQGVFNDKAALVTDVSFSQNAYALVNAQLEAGKTPAEVVELLGENNFPTDLAQGLVDSIQTYRDTISGLETDVETGEGLTQFAQQAYDYVNGQLDAETSLDDIVADLIDNGYSEAGANALVTNIDGMRTNLSAAETSLGTANANQLFGQTAYSFVNEQLELIANQDPDAEVQLSENDIIAKLVENGFSEDNAATLVGNVTTIRTTETTLRDQIDGLEAENTFAEGAYDFVNTRLDAMLGQDPDAEVQITPESIVNELVENGFDQTTAESLVSNVTTVKDKVADLGMQLDTLGTEASFAQRAYSYVNSMFDQGKTAEEISSSLVEKGFAEDTASTLVTSVDGTRTTLAGLETDLGTAQDQRTFAQRAFDFVNQQLDGEVSVDDIRQDLLDNGFSELDADALITDATDIRSNTDLLEANNSFAQGAYGFINEQLESGSQTTDIIQEMIDNGFGYDKAQSMVTNVVNVQNEVDTLSDALGIMEGRAEFAQTSFDYINNQLDNNVTEDALLNDLVENYGFTADNAQNFVDSVQDTRFRETELQRIKTATTTGTTFDFGGRMVGRLEE